MEKIISYFIKFPVAVNIFILAFFAFGLAGALSMKSSYFPLTESQNISINLVYPGASPEEMEEGIVLKIEDNLKGIVGIDRVTSVSRENSASINIETLKGKNIGTKRSEEFKENLRQLNIGKKHSQEYTYYKNIIHLIKQHLNYQK
jgi:multidrug efflux pump subunit AcrB